MNQNQMEKENLKYWYRAVSNIIVTAIIIGIFWYTWNRGINIYMDRAFQRLGNYLMAGVYGVIAILFVNTFGGYKIGVNRISHVILSQFLALFFTNIIELVIDILTIGYVSVFWPVCGALVLMSIMQAVVLFFVTFILMKLYRVIFPPYRLLMVYGDHKNQLSNKMNARMDKYIIAGEISYREPIEKIAGELKNYDAVLINDIPSENKNQVLKECFEHGKRVYFTPKIADIIVRNSEELNLFDTPLYLCRNLQMSMAQRFFKRLGDIVLSLIGIILTSPIMLVTAICVHNYDKGPVLYKQTRCTIDGKEFQIMKFRSMIVNAEKNSGAVLAKENDDRITPVGHFIRATRIDELPQLFNILKGEMSLVGPRPERPEICEQYCAEIPEFSYRLRVKAGLTGYAQVYGKYNTTNYDKLKMDLIYVEKASVLLDMKLILLTLKVIFQKEATEGLEEGQTTASTSNENHE